MMIVQNGCRVGTTTATMTQLKLYKLSHQHPKICSEPAVVLFQLFNEEGKLYLSISRGCTQNPLFFFMEDMMMTKSSSMEDDSVFPPF